jgi:GDP-fucose transporter C1
VIIFGFFFGVDQESMTSSFSLIGTIFGIAGSLALSLYSIYTKKTLKYVNQEVWLLSYYNNAYSVFLFLPLIIVSGELKTVMAYEHLKEMWFWGKLSLISLLQNLFFYKIVLGFFLGMMTVSGLCGFLIGYVTSLQIKVTSPLTHNISGTAKACAQTVLATSYYNESRTNSWWASNFIVLFGSFAYARVKQLEMSKRHKDSQMSQKI